MLDIFTSPTPIGADPDENSSLITIAGNEFPVSRKLTDVMAQLAPGKLVQWVSNGDWSMHELLLAMLEKTGPATVHISSYAFSEKPARIIAGLVHSRVISSLYCIIDSRVDTRSASALSLLQGCAYSCKLLATHAKVTVVANNSCQLVAIGSANYTENHRYEAGVLLEDFHSAIYHQNWITHAIAGMD